MASRFSLEAVFRAIDKFTSPVNKMTGTSRRFSNALQRDFRRAQRQVNNFATNFKRNLGRNLLIGVGIATAAIGKLAVESSKAWDIQAAAIKNVEAGLKSTGGTAGRTLEQLQKQAADIEKNTFIGDESVLQGVTAQMLTFTNLTGRQFDRAQQVVVDVDAKIKGLNVTTESLTSRSIQLSKALNDVANLGALSKSGIQFSAEQKKLAKELYNTGRIAEYQDLVLTELERQYGGTAAALAQTAGGMQLQLKNTTGTMLELIGKGIEPLRLKFLEFMNKVLPKLLPIIAKFTSFIENNADAIFSTFIGVLSGAWNVLKVIGNVLSTVFKILKPFAPIIMGIVGAMLAYKAALIIAAIAQGIMNAVMAVNPITLIIIGIGILIGLIYILIKNWNKIIRVFKKAWDIIKKVGRAIGDFFIKGFQKLGEWLDKNFSKFSMFLGPIGALIEIIRELGSQWENIKKIFSEGDILGGILQIGKAILSGLLAPIQGFLELVSQIPGVGDLAKGGAEKIRQLREGLRGFENKSGKETEGGKDISFLPITTTTERTTTAIEETTSKSELIIKDESGKAKLGKRKGSKKGTKIKLESSAVFEGA